MSVWSSSARLNAASPKAPPSHFRADGRPRQWLGFPPFRGLCGYLTNAHIRPAQWRKPRYRGRPVVVPISKLGRTIFMASETVQQIIKQMGDAIGANSGLG